MHYNDYLWCCCCVPKLNWREGVHYLGGGKHEMVQERQKRRRKVQMDGQTYQADRLTKQTDRPNRQTDQTDRQTRLLDQQTDRQTKQTDYTDKHQTDRQTGQIDRHQTDRQIDRADSSYMETRSNNLLIHFMLAYYSYLY